MSKLEITTFSYWFNQYREWRDWKTKARPVISTHSCKFCTLNTVVHVAFLLCFAFSFLFSAHFLKQISGVSSLFFHLIYLPLLLFWQVFTLGLTSYWYIYSQYSHRYLTPEFRKLIFSIPCKREEAPVGDYSQLSDDVKQEEVIKCLLLQTHTHIHIYNRHIHTGV